MKKILITGANSYIGTSFENYIKQWPEKYNVDTIDMIDGTWREKSFAGYDTVFHVAGIAHIKETKENKQLYYKINRDLAIEVAIKAKNSNVKHFILMSSMSVYGILNGRIYKNTLPMPKTNYGKAKLAADEEISKMSSKDFVVTIVRPPMVYGQGCKGNYQAIRKIVLHTMLFPNINNSRSMIYIENLCIYIKHYIDEEMEGIYFPQNKEYVSTTEMVRQIANNNNKKIIFVGIFNFIIRYMIKQKVNLFGKVFGSLEYEFDTDSLVLIDFENSIKRTEERI